MGQGKAGNGTLNTAATGANNTGQAATGAAGTAGALANTYTGKQAGYASAADPFAKSLIPGANGALSPYAQAQFNQAKNNIDKTYQGQAQASLRGAAARGMGGPTGLDASIANTAGQNEGAATTNAYQQAQQGTLGAGLQGVNYLQNQQQIYNPVNALGAQSGLLNAASNAYGTGVNAGKAQNQEGTLLGGLGNAFSMVGDAGLIPG